MIAHYGSRLPKNLKVDDYTINQVELHGQITIAPDGNMVTIYEDDLPMLKKQRYSHGVERSACN